MLYSAVSGEQNQSTVPVVLLHGLFGSSDNLAVIRRHLEKDYRVISIDLPDHGNSPHFTEFSFDAWAQEVITCIQQHTDQAVNIVAHSLGGKVAMATASMQASMVNKLVILDIAPVNYPPRHENVMKALNSVDLGQLNSRQAAMQSMLNHVSDRNVIAFLLKSLVNIDGQWRWRFNLPLIQREYERVSDWPYSGKLFSGPTYFIKGKQSDYIIAEHQDIIMQQFPQAQAKIVDAGHWLHAEKPHLVNSLLTRLLPDN